MTPARLAGLLFVLASLAACGGSDDEADPAATDRVPAASDGDSVDEPVAEPVMSDPPATDLDPDAAATIATEPSEAPPAGRPIALRADVWADNWFRLWVNGELIGEDSVPITTERSFNAEAFTFEASLPLTVALEARDFKEDDSGLEYIGTDRQQMGDGGVILQILDADSGELVVATDETWRVLVTHVAPLDKDCERSASPGTECGFVAGEAPDGWTEIGFDHGEWDEATVWREADVGPKDGYDEVDWDPAAALVWGADLETDNTVLLRATTG